MLLGRRGAATGRAPPPLFCHLPGGPGTSGVATAPGGRGV